MKPPAGLDVDALLTRKTAAQAHVAVAERMAALQAQILAATRDHAQFEAAAAAPDGVASAVDALAARFRRAHDALAAEQAEEARMERELEQAEAALAQTDERLAAVASVCDLQAILRDSAALEESAGPAAAAERLADGTRVGLPPAAAKVPLVAGLQTQLAKARAALAQDAMRTLDQHVEFSSHTLRLVAHARVPEACRVLWHLELLDDRAVHIAAQVMEIIVEPLFRGKHKLSVAREASAGASASGKGDTRVVHVAKAAEQSLADVCKQLEQLVRALLPTLVGANGTPVVREALGAVLWPRIADAMIPEVLVPLVPTRSDMLPEFEDTVVRQVERFEAAVAETGLLGPTLRPLTEYVANAEGHFAGKKRAAALERTRELALVRERGKMQVTLGESGVDPLWQRALPRFPQCHITEQAHDFAQVVEHLIADTEGAPPACADTFWQTARDCLDLYRALLGIWHARMIENQPHLAELLRNDYMYVAHRLATALDTDERRERLPGMTEVFRWEGGSVGAA